MDAHGVFMFFFKQILVLSTKSVLPFFCCPCCDFALPHVLKLHSFATSKFWKPRPNVMDVASPWRFPALPFPKLAPGSAMTNHPSLRMNTGLPGEKGCAGTSDKSLRTLILF